ncbi:hypothetical protein [Staphylococcus pettenkoferi]|uniref:hypothetical protein n=1 Tax=Staphylococcus pettenkoferi TaxID=170573 RepID=UPI0022748DC0|nr:hypothetical protein [Staphylococcus pettenkoferi]MCY1589535.1 hypothetical protein [Staphylococcus pettenkoferi]MCY1592443.1 hypothetical protein [Staphylococcus pettenkoferi]MCY1599040.1 hypothetical protein [Staphylococcus pettenkoferi]MCY1602599.1 hypothetical protein [Staphylococcus pettenkoferi]MCY1608913.1 hypothetical protein [Staphylococcus pettenkoferi]
MSEIRMVTYEPMIFRKEGAKIVSEYDDIPEYLDASIRTEPSLNVKYPGISSLCRGEKLAPKLKVGDKVIYITKKSTYHHEFNHWRLVAILEVIKVMKTHEETAEWYKNNNYELPKNCLVKDNPPLSFNKTTIPKEKICDAEEDYQCKASEHSQFNICKKIHVELDHPPIIDESKMEEIFGIKNPGTQNFKYVEEHEYNKLLELMKG